MATLSSLSLALLLAFPSASAAADDLAEAIRRIGEKAVTQPGVPGISIGVARGDDIVFEDGFGLADVEHEVPCDEDTVFRIGSITKQFAAAGILLLAERGELSLDTTLAELYDDFDTQGRTITVHHLLNHTSGIKSYTGLGREWREKIRLDLEDEALLDLVEDEPFDFEPGERFLYNNTGYFLLGTIIEELTYEEYGDFFEDEFFEPIGMESSRVGDAGDIVKNRARGYRLAGGLKNAEYISMTQPGAAGALLSTVGDLIRWQRALVRGEVVTAESYARMITPTVLPDGENTGYGYGLQIGEWRGTPVISHGGGINGFTSMLAYYPDHEVTIVVLGNGGSAPTGRIERQIAEAVLGLEDPTRDARPLAASEIERYLGTYDIPVMKLKIFEEEGKMMAQGQAPGQGAFELLSIGEHDFVSRDDDDIRVSFEMADGAATSVALTQGSRTFKGKRM